MKFHQQLLLTGLILFSTGLYANGIPIDNQGDTIPTPTGNVPYFSASTVFAADNAEYTWDYSGTLDSGNDRFSFQATVAQLTQQKNAALDMNMFLFSFQDANHFFFSNSNYGGENQIAQAVSQSMNIGQSSAGLNHFSVTDALIANPASQWSISSVDTTPKAPLYKGWVGQPGREYQLSGTGKTFLWRYNKTTGAQTIAPYTYTFSVGVIDTRGVTMEGLGGGYVGPKLVPESQHAHPAESEIAQPRLRVLNWDVTFCAAGNVAGFQSQYHFSGNNGMLWNDLGPVDESYSNNPALKILIQSQLPSNVAAAFPALQSLGSASLYNGNWIPVEFTRGKYAGASLSFAVFWNKTQAYPSDQSTAILSWSNQGWCNYFSGLLPNEVDSALSSIETLYPENPILPSPDSTEIPPYQVVLNQFVPDKYHPAFPWVQKATIMIKANTPLRYELAAYADQLAKNTVADDPSQDLVITVSAISPVTQNTLFSKTVSQYYEGAAVPSVDGQVVGYSWLEHMVN